MRCSLCLLPGVLLVLLLVPAPPLAAQTPASDFRTVDAVLVKTGDKVDLVGLLEVLVVDSESGKTIGGLWSEKHFAFFVFDLDPDNAKLFQWEGKRVAVRAVVVERLGEHYKVKIEKFKKL